MIHLSNRFVTKITTDKSNESIHLELSTPTYAPTLPSNHFLLYHVIQLRHPTMPSPFFYYLSSCHVLLSSYHGHLYPVLSSLPPTPSFHSVQPSSSLTIVPFEANLQIWSFNKCLIIHSFLHLFAMEVFNDFIL
jgi:hypothetical protein